MPQTDSEPAATVAVSIIVLQRRPDASVLATLGSLRPYMASTKTPAIPGVSRALAAPGVNDASQQLEVMLVHDSSWSFAENAEEVKELGHRVRRVDATPQALSNLLYRLVLTCVGDLVVFLPDSLRLNDQNFHQLQSIAAGTELGWGWFELSTRLRQAKRSRQSASGKLARSFQPWNLLDDIADVLVEPAARINARGTLLGKPLPYQGLLAHRDLVVAVGGVPQATKDPIGALASQLRDRLPAIGNRPLAHFQEALTSLQAAVVGEFEGVEKAMGDQQVALLEVSNLTVRVPSGQPILNRLSLQLMPDECLWIRGINGSGKSTLLKALLGLVAVHSGRILWKGQGAKLGEPAYRQFLAESASLYHQETLSHWLSVQEELWHSLSGKPVPSSEKQQRLEQAIDTFGLQKLRLALCGRLSVGERRRVSLAALDLRDAQLWILDEPLASLDADWRNAVSQVMQRRMEQGVAILVTSHESLPFASRALRLQPATT